MTTFFMPTPSDQLVPAFIDYLRFEKRLSMHTVKAYTEDLNQFFQYTTDQYEISDPGKITTIYIRSWMASLAESELNPKSINRKLSCLRSFFTFCRRTGQLEHNPAASIQVLKTSKRLPSYVEEAQMNDLFQYVEFPDTATGKTERMAMLILYQTGIRVSELVNIREEHINQSLKSIKVLGKGNKERIIPLGENLLHNISLYLREKKKTGKLQGRGICSSIIKEGNSIPARFTAW